MKRIGLLAVASVVAGCATPPDQIKASEVSPEHYSSLSCDELGAEYGRLSDELEPMIAAQSSARSADVAGVVLIGLPVGSMTAKESDKERVDAIADLKGKQAAVRTARTQKGCA